MKRDVVMNNHTKKEAIIQNLKDAGCNKNMIDCFMEYFTQDERKEELMLLEKHRCNLLFKVHDSQRKIDCLDYLIYQIKKQEMK